MTLSFQSPSSLLVTLVAVGPLVALVVHERRSARLREALGLARPGRVRPIASAGVLAACFVLLGLAAARPVIRLRSPERARTDAAAFVVVDVSRSMLATPRRGAETRYARALAFARRLRPRLGDVPVGVASLTDRTLPHLFPTADRRAYVSVLEQALAVGRPPPSLKSWNATDFGSLVRVPTDNFFAPSLRKRLVVLVSDGESVPFAARSIASTFRSHQVGLIVVRVGAAVDRIFDARGRDVGYRPVRAAFASTDRLAALLGDRVYRDSEVGAVGARARVLLGHGPTVPIGTGERDIELGRPLVLAAGVLLALLFGLRYRPVGRTNSPAAALSPIARSSPFRRTVNWPAAGWADRTSSSRPGTRPWS
jgi:hypothetical protein